MAGVDDGGPVIEGFICPMCKCDLGTSARLLTHFQEEHYEEQDLVKTFKDLLDKAKRKILKTQETSPGHTYGQRTLGFDTNHLCEVQDMGYSYSHMKEFLEIRNVRLQSLSIPQNQLIIRLEKLLDNMPTDPIKKKAHEQNIVHWIDGTNVTRCPNCAGQFHLARRQHHCRTCGSIMCQHCSHFMTIQTARRILDKPLPQDSNQNQNSRDNCMRLCEHCISILERMEQMKEMQTKKPIISQFYEKLAEYRRQADEHYSVYIRMCESLNAKLAVLGTKDTDAPPQGQALRLQMAVRSAAVGYLRNQLLRLPPLPTEQQFEEMQEKRRREITARINEEKLKHARLQQNHTTNSVMTRPSPKPVSNDLPVSKGQGWVPEKTKVNESGDPLVEQMNIIRSYIKDARAAQKFDEATSLEQNLKDLKKEFLRKLQVQDDISR
ncbi:hypothetical protein AAG570_004556 [Ranatra chinensis]|uniref:FYVE-type domain-containing protein n=1 Tax=Ranatra chinensis TaxID=642074 RepID=A0ABD0YPS2_9HEMI